MNVDWISRWPAPIRRALYFSLQRGIGSRIGPVWREFLAWEQFSPGQLQAAVDAKLSRTLESATRSSEYYRELKLERRPNETAAEWLRRFPILTRAQVRTQFTRIVTDSLRNEITSPESVSRKRYDWLVVKTGGSTGIPTTVVHDANARDWGRATRLYAARQCGFPLGTPYFRLWGSEQDLLNQQVALRPRLLRALLAEIPMNAFRARKADLQRHLETVRSRPDVRHLMTYVDAAVSLAFFIHDEKLPGPRFKTVMSCAGTLTPEFRRTLQETFSAEVFDKYGSRECSDLACECSRHNGLHVFAPHAYLEVVDAAGRDCAPGETGRILVTLLNNPGFPMVRYEIGDMAVRASNDPCPCGSPFPRLQSLQGRQDDMLLTQDGTLQSSSFVRHFVGVSLNRQIIGEWQVEQTSPTHFIFRYIALREDGLEENLAKIQESFRTVFGGQTEVAALRVTDIPPTPSGKIRWIINHCGKTAAAAGLPSGGN